MTPRGHSRRLRVSHIIPNLGVGGAEAMVRALVGWQVGPCDVSVVTLFDTADASIVASNGPANAVGLGKRLGPDPRIPSRLARALRRLQPDIIHTHCYALPYLLPVLPIVRRPVVHTLHTTPSADAGRWWLQAPYRAAFARRVRAVAISATNAQLFEDFYGRAPSAVIPHGIDVERFDVDDNAGLTWRREHGIAPGDLVVASVARLAPEKRHVDLLAAFGRLLKSHSGARLLLAGDGPLRGALEAEVARDPDLAGAVRFLGNVDDIPVLLAAADVVVLTSEREGVPLSVLEAMAARRSVIATAVGGVPDVVVHGVSGLLVPPGAPSALSSALSELADDADRRACMGQAARALVVERNSLETMGAAYLDLYGELAR